ncbi:PREDICTED: uncharacterized protein LOC105568287 [Vollenhovia emeryi]|uniref:uncharacterized protein LOC105568287 n=1 Tax=Vollenhovia emeryi TaxID=411798 RepID=UPI0005F3C26D|nr:PREDICTED: uncharacterized protein LOC105568287 [Vollenhovia emeryi]
MATGIPASSSGFPPFPAGNADMQWDRGGDDPVLVRGASSPLSAPAAGGLKSGYLIPYRRMVSVLPRLSSKQPRPESPGSLTPFQGKGRLLVGERPSRKPPMPKTALSGFQTDARLQAPSPRQGGLPRGGT